MLRRLRKGAGPLTNFAEVAPGAVAAGCEAGAAQQYTYGLQLLSRRDTNTGLSGYYVRDGHGSVRALTDTLVDAEIRGQTESSPFSSGENKNW